MLESGSQGDVDLGGMGGLGGLLGGMGGSAHIASSALRAPIDTNQENVDLLQRGQYNLGAPDMYAAGQMNGLYAKHTGRPIEQIERDMERDFFMSADEAKAYGIVDNVLAMNSFPRLDTAPKP